MHQIFFFFFPSIIMDQSTEKSEASSLKQQLDGDKSPTPVTDKSPVADILPILPVAPEFPDGGLRAWLVVAGVSVISFGTVSLIFIALLAQGAFSAFSTWVPLDFPCL
jgi:hypothetical protein